MRAPKPPGGRRWRISSPSCPRTASPTCMPDFSLMACSWSTSMYSALQPWAGLRSASTARTRRSKAGAGVEPGERVVAGLDDADRLAREDLGDVRVALGEAVGDRLAQQREHADRPPGARVQPAAQHAVGQPSRDFRPTGCRSPAPARAATARASAAGGGRASGTGCRGRWGRPSAPASRSSPAPAAPRSQACRCSMVCCSSCCSSFAPSALCWRSAPAPWVSSRCRSLSSAPTVWLSSSMVACAIRSRRRHSSAGASSE